MASLRSWLRGAQPSISPAASAAPSVGGAQLSPADREISDIEDAMAAAGMIMDDDIEGAEARLKLRKDSSAFHQLGLGVAAFMRSALGFEKEIMAEASNRLLECETRAWAEMKKAQKDTGSGWFGRGAPPKADAAGTSQIYPPGSEFALVHAEAQLMGAIVAVMHESVTDAIKGFYRLRKAFIALNAIMEAEGRALKEPSGGENGTVRRPSLSEDTMPGSFDEAEFEGLVAIEERSTETEAGMDFIQVPRALPQSDAVSTPMMPATSEPRLAPEPEAKSSSGEQTPAAPPGSGVPLSPPKAEDNSPSSSLFTNPVDAFVHSGANMCFGFLLLIISMVPPAFSRLLYIIGFKGDRERGLGMLWKSTKFANVNGAMAGLILLSYYNGMMTSADIIPARADIEELADPNETVGMPTERLASLLARMSAQSPNSRLWHLEEARTLANNKNLDEAIDRLRSGSEGKMKQVTALAKFELSLNAMHSMKWSLMRDSFMQCMELNDWSHALYYYLAGCAELELYRDAFHLAKSLAGDQSKEREREHAETAAAKHMKTTEEYFRKTPAVAGKKRFMARQMPFEVYVLRKVAKWEERASALGVDLADAVGVSPAQEMVYLWNGSKKMPPALLEGALACLSWDRCTVAVDKVETMKSAPDESAIKGICDAALLRSMGRLDEARKALDEEVLKHDRYVPQAAAFRSKASRLTTQQHRIQGPYQG